eukprot:TRINITY_DN1476_c0_g1_i1.p1 TRINITY_DN1476_c0_g1~~TRINITY_DN1476_c0_g1_i1.p1  ORF type:complete len:219 (-),score=73.14 TRINITY_DN1476_c0_g1_i1:716-1372(-)
MVRTALSITHVVYEQGDVVGKALAYASLLPIFVVAMAAAAVLVRRDVQAIAFLTAQLLNELVNQLLKRSLQHSRPDPEFHAHGYGMPSSHAQFMAFLSVSLAFAIAYRTQQHPRWVVVGMYAGVAASAAIVCFSRVYLRYHTPEQVLVGCCIGLALSLLWNLFASERAAAAISTALRRCGLWDALLLKDIGRCTDPLLLERRAHMDGVQSVRTSKKAL